MARVLAPFLLALLFGGAALLLGLTGITLRTGRIDVLDWLLQGLAALFLLLLTGRRSGSGPAWPSVASAWALIALPPALLVLLAGSRMPWPELLLLGGALATGAAIIAWALARPARTRWPALAMLALAAIALRWTMLPAAMPQTRAADAPAIGVVSALPLYGPALAEAEQGDPLQGAGRMSPLWRVLSGVHDLRPVDHIDAASLAPFRRLLVAQPRALAPEELVALDAWVRGGGYALILADPLLHWPDPRPLGHPHRAPLTSLLDPLLGHWGLRLEPDQYAVEGDPVVRRVLKSGALLQMAGASRFTRIGKGEAACRLGEDGLIALCTVGQGSARLVADADWINDTLWTLDPMSPHAPAAWASDTIPALVSWLRPEALRVDSPGVWLIDQDRLISALRWAMLALLLLAVLRVRLSPLPTLSHSAVREGGDQNGNIGGLKPDSG